MEDFVNMPNTKIDIISWHNDTSNDMGEEIAKHIKTAKQVDILTGYFFFDGIKAVQDALAKNPGVTLRILVGMDAGIDTGGLIYEVYDHEKTHSEDDDAIRKDYLEKLRKVLKNWPEPLTQAQADAWHQYPEMIKEGRLQIRKTAKPNHSKVYIFHPKNGETFYTVGSSNFTGPGLGRRNEFNVGITRERAKEVGDIFEALWEKSVRIAGFIDRAKTSEQAPPEGPTSEPAPPLVEPIQETVAAHNRACAAAPFDAYMKVLCAYMNMQRPDEKLDYEIRSIMKGAKYPNAGPDSDGRVVPHQYQIDAIHRAHKILEVYNGVILADVVGLGKSIVASVLACLSHAPGIVIAPPALCGEENWESHLAAFHLAPDKDNKYGWKCHSYESDIDQDELDKAQTIIIDEAHNIRNRKTKAYERLKEICRGKRVIFLSATPFNNKPDDILALISLIPPVTIAGKSPAQLETDFGEFSKRYLDIKNNTDVKNKTDIAKRRKLEEELSEDIREIVAPITVRRNRLDLIGENSPYRKEMQPLIPEIAPPRKETFELGKDVAGFYTKILEKYFAKEKAFKGFMYTPELSNGGTSNTEEQLYDMICYFVVARLESSPVAFRKTVENIRRTLDNSIKLFKKEGVFLRLSRDPAPGDIDGDGDFSAPSEDWKAAIRKYKHTIYVNSEERKQKLLDEFGLDWDKKTVTVTVLGEPEKFLEDLKADYDVLGAVLNEFNDNKLDGPKKDAKFQCLVKNIRGVLNGELDKGTEDEGKLRKAIVFSGFADTAEYVAQSLDAMDEFKGKVMFVSGKNIKQKLLRKEALDMGFSEKEYHDHKERIDDRRPLTMRDAVIRNFKKKALEKNTKSLKEQKAILVCTDVLSEGIDLNAAGIVFNYDMAYNPVRIIQRLGRINRIGTKVFEKLYRVNFFPTDLDINRVEKISTLKADIIQEIFAEDASILTDDETVKGAVDMSEELEIRNMYETALARKCKTAAEPKEYLDRIGELAEGFGKYSGEEEAAYFFFPMGTTISAMRVKEFASRKKTEPALEPVRLVEALRKIRVDDPDLPSLEFRSAEGDPLWESYIYWQELNFIPPVDLGKTTKQILNKARNALYELGDKWGVTIDGKIYDLVDKSPDFANEINKIYNTNTDDLDEAKVESLYEKYRLRSHEKPGNKECLMAVGIMRQAQEKESDK